MNADVLVVGAGPTGLMLALQLARRGVKTLVVDKKPGLTSETRALGVQARTLEIYDQLGIGAEAKAQGLIAAGASIWVRGQLTGRLAFDQVGRGQSPHPYVFMLSQDLNEALLLKHFQAAGGAVEWNTELKGFNQDRDSVSALLSGPEGERTVRIGYLAGCDGGHSAVRRILGTRFPGGTYGQSFFVADTRARGNLSEGELNLSFQDEGFRAFLPMPGQDRYRIVGLVPPRLRDKEDLSFDDVRADTERNFGVSVEEVYWFSRYLVHHRVAAHFRSGRTFLLGDAAHVHSPVGAQGMNTGLQDATNLGWKLAAVLGGAPAALLDSYPIEREPFARLLVNTTDRAFQFITGRAGRWFRVLWPRLALRLASAFPFLRAFAFRLISQIWINYRKSPLSRNLGDGGVRAGDRLPWVQDVDNFAPLKSCDWQLHTYGGPYCGWLRTPFHFFAFTPECARKGLKKGVLYLIRPDGYVAVVANGSGQVSDYMRDILGDFRT